MKKLLPLTLAATLGFLATALAGPVHAAPGAKPAKAPGARMQKLADALGLSPTQKAQMKPVLQDAARQATALQADTALTPQAKMDKMKDIRRSTNQQMMAILTPAQREKLKAMRRQQRAAKGGNA